MPEVERYQNLVLGSGEAGKYIAWTMAKEGQHTAVVERKLIGGSCPNIACLPSKNVIHSAEVAALFRRGPEFGIKSSAFSIDMNGVRDRKRKMVKDLQAIHIHNYQASGAELIMGEGRLVGSKTIQVQLNEGGSRLLAGERIFLNVGTHAAVPDAPGLAGAKPLTHVEALELDRIPEHLIVLGGGYSGLEFAQAMRRLGARVTIVEQQSQLAPREDSDVGEALGQLCSDILVTAGRVPNTQGIGLEDAGIKLDERAYIKVNERLETTAPDVWAMGECAGSPQFTHVSFDDFRIVRDNLNGGQRTTRGRLVPYCMFLDPELGRVGMNETEAEHAGISYRVSKIPAAAVLRTRTLSETRGFLKALIDVSSDRILGFTAFCAGAGELIAVVQTAMLAGMPYTFLRDAILTHPTMAEGLTVLFANAPVARESKKQHSAA